MEENPAQRSTWAGCLLVLLAVVTTIAACLLFGKRWFSFVATSVPQENRNDGVELPDEHFLDLPLVKLGLGILIFGVAILPGLAVYYAGERLFTRLRIPVWKDPDPEAP